MAPVKSRNEKKFRIRTVLTSRTSIEQGEDEDILLSMSSFLSAEQNPTPDAFAQFAAPTLLLRPEVDGVMWIPFVPDSRKADFEAEARKYFPGFSIHERNPRGAAIAIPVHFPVYYEQPSSDEFLGLDLGSEIPLS